MTGYLNCCNMICIISIYDPLPPIKTYHHFYRCVNQVSIGCLSALQILHWSLKRANHVHHSKSIFFIWVPCRGKHKPVQQKGLNNYDWLACSTLTEQKHCYNPGFLEKLHRWYIVWIRCDPECKQGRSINPITPDNSQSLNMKFRLSTAFSVLRA